MTVLSQDVAHTAATIIPVFVIAYLLEAQRVRAMFLIDRPDVMPWSVRRKAASWTIGAPATVTVLLVMLVPEAGVSGEWGWCLAVVTAAAMLSPVVMTALTMLRVHPEREAAAAAAYNDAQAQKFKDRWFKYMTDPQVRDDLNAARRQPRTNETDGD